MKHTVGYTANASLPIQIAYRCSNCGYLNIHKCILHTEEFDFTKNAVNSSVSEAFKSRINAIQNGRDIEALKNAAIEGKCLRCKNIEKWSKKEGLSSLTVIRIALFFVLVLFIGIPVFQVFSEDSVSVKTPSPNNQLLLGIGIPAALVVFLIIVGIVFLVKGRNNKKVDIPKESLPVIITIGEIQNDSEEWKTLRQTTAFMENEKDTFIKTIKKCKSVKKIYVELTNIKRIYSELFSEELLSKIDILSQKEELDGVSQKESAIRIIEAYLTHLEDNAPINYLNSLK